MIKIKHKDGKTYEMDDLMFDRLVASMDIKAIKKEKNRVLKISERIMRVFETENSISSGKLRNYLRVDVDLFNKAVNELELKKMVRIEKIENEYKPNGYFNIVYCGK